MKKLYVVFFSAVVLITACKKSAPAIQTNNPPTDTIPSNPVPPDTTVNTGIHDTLPTVWYDNDNMLLGDPGDAMPDEDSTNNFLIRKADYSVSYSRDRGIPNWVSWHLYVQDEGTASRQDDFEPDNNLPASWYHVTNGSYLYTGFDRGHNCPSGDRTSTTTANLETYVMTNIIPQAPKNNQQPWNDMENYVRAEVAGGWEAYIIMGNYGIGGDGDNGFANTIDNGRVTVPAHVWKVVVLLANGNNDTSRINADTRVIAVDLPNTNSVNTNWKTYRTSVDAIEAATGYDLLSRLPANVQDAIEEKVDKE